MARTVSINEFKSKLTRPATTSNFYVEIGIPSGTDFSSFLSDRGLNFGTSEAGEQGTLNILCAEASLPGSSLATLELTSDHTGVTEKHVHRRVFDQNIDLTFYVNADNYLPIRFFEGWMDYISGSNTDEQLSKNYHYRMNYVDDYTSDQGLKITKFERDSYQSADQSISGSGIPNLGQLKTNSSLLTYTFVRAFPIQMSSMPVSYEASSLLKCTVSMSYIRYVVGKNTPSDSKNSSQGDYKNPTTLSQQFLNQNGGLTLPSQTIA